MPAGRQPGDVAEHRAAGQEHLGLSREVGAAGLDQVDQRQPVLPRDLHRAQHLADRERVAGAAADGRVVGDDHALDALDDADPGDQAAAGCSSARARRRTATAPGTACPGRPAGRSVHGPADSRERGAAPPRARRRPTGPGRPGLRGRPVPSASRAAVDPEAIGRRFERRVQDSHVGHLVAPVSPGGVGRDRGPGGTRPVLTALHPHVVRRQLRSGTASASRSPPGPPSASVRCAPSSVTYDEVGMCST